jgi:glyoxylase-like metal-dependent hydrolase (beta-lactamase superfamily II)
VTGVRVFSRIAHGSATYRACLSPTSAVVCTISDLEDRNMGTQSEALKWEVFVTPGIPVAQAERPEGIKETFFQAMASTIIYGERDAVLVDAFMTVAQANTLADWVASKHKNLTTIYITHGHGDHWFGVGTLLARFPHAKVVATANTIQVMQGNASPQGLAAWGAAFPGQIPQNLVMAEELKGDVFELEGRDLRVVELGHTDTDATTCLYVPSLGLVVAGDAVYNDVHLYLVESTSEQRHEWLAALDKIEALKPTAVVASHKRPESNDSPRIIDETRQYIRDFDRLLKATSSRQELYEKMLALYPNRVNPGWALWSSAHAAKP